MHFVILLFFLHLRQHELIYNKNVAVIAVTLNKSNMVFKHELRIGNWILNNEDLLKKIASGVEIDEAEIFSPIPLNDEVLKRCGFFYQDYFKVWQKTEELPKNTILLEMDNDYNIRDFGGRYIGVRLKSLHQLQNFFFALKGIELEFKEAEVL
jgi:hypothetical protein